MKIITKYYLYIDFLWTRQSCVSAAGGGADVHGGHVATWDADSDGTARGLGRDIILAGRLMLIHNALVQLGEAVAVGRGRLGLKRIADHIWPHLDGVLVVVCGVFGRRHDA